MRPIVVNVEEHGIDNILVHDGQIRRWPTAEQVEASRLSDANGVFGRLLSQTTSRYCMRKSTRRKQTQATAGPHRKCTYLGSFLTASALDPSDAVLLVENGVFLPCFRRRGTVR